MANTGAIGEEKSLNDLKLVRRIAAGGMAEVWEARKEGVEGFQKRLAVKVVLPHLTENEEFIEMFLDEGRLAARLDHPNICQITDLGQANDTYYMAMEYIDGLPLSDIMKSAAKRGIFIPFEHCCQILIGACGGLDYAHASTDLNGEPLSLVHRDISPQNIMVTFNGTVKVVDFGIAKAATKIHNTRAGVLKGKFAYMSPEQATGQELDRRSDIFALGILLWELTTGNRLFRADNEIATLHKIIGGGYPRPSDYRDNYPVELERIIFKALSIDVNERYQDCGDFQIELEDFLMRNSLAAGAKRLARYVKWLHSDTDQPAPQSASVVMNAFGESNSGIHSPPPTGRMTNLNLNLNRTNPPAGQMKPSSAPNNFGGPSLLTGPDPIVDPMLTGHGSHLPSNLPKRRKSGGIWFALLFILLLVGGVSAFYLLPQREVEPATQMKKLFWLVKSEPQGATIYLNGVPKGKTPRVLKVKQNERYIIQIGLKGYKPRTLEIPKLTEMVSQKGVSITLIKRVGKIKYGSVLFKVFPQTAKVTLNNKRLKASMAGGVYSLGKIPIYEPNTLLVQKKGYKDKISRFTLESTKQKALEEMRLTLRKKKKIKKVKPSPQESVAERRKRRRKERERRAETQKKEKLRVEVQRKAKRRAAGAQKKAKRKAEVKVSYLSLTSIPSGAHVALNGRVIGRTPLRKTKFKSGRYTIRLTKTGYRTLSLKMNFNPNELKKFTLRLRTLESTQAIVSFGCSPRSKIYMDGKLLGTSPIWKRSIPTGRHSFRFKTVKFGVSRSKTLFIRSGSQKLVERFPKGKLFPLTRPGANVFLNGRFAGKSNQGSISVPAGTYKVKLVFTNGKVRFRYKFSIRAGQTNKLKAFAQ